MITKQKTDSPYPSEFWLFNAIFFDNVLIEVNIVTLLGLEVHTKKIRSG